MTDYCWPARMEPAGPSDAAESPDPTRGLDQPIRHRRIRAPREDRSVLFDPPGDQATKLFHANRQLLASYDAPSENSNSQIASSGPLLARIAREARAALIEHAAQYTAAYRDTSGIDLSPDAPIVLSGHQPTLFHPGVWLKNFALSSIGQLTGSVAINLVVDNDTLRSAAVNIPARVDHQPTLQSIAIDNPSREIPYEERPIADRTLFNSFSARLSQSLAAVMPEQARTAIVDKLWPYALAAADRRTDGANHPPLLGQVLAEARHRLELDYGLATLELPLSEVAQLDAFRQFSLVILAQLASFQNHYNSALAEYRQANRVRSRSHPVPDLASENDWLEAPFWIWTCASPQRRRLFVRTTATQLEITDRASLHETLPAINEANLAPTISAWQALEARGIKIRPRALITTMFARLCLSDLFLHGIGGAKYDELTDAIIRRFWKVQPPAYFTLTATIRLPVERPDVSREEIAHLKSLARELRFHGERFVFASDRDQGELAPELLAAADAKRKLLRDGFSPGNKRDWQHAIERANLTLATGLAPRAKQFADELQVRSRELKHAESWGSREFSIVNFPEGILTEVLLDFCKRLS